MDATAFNGQAQKPDISVFFPIYNDELTVRRVTEKAISVLQDVAHKYEVLIIDDCGPDRAGEIADELAREYDCVKGIHHPKNLGYGAAVRTGLAHARYAWICFTDGDDQYDLYDLYKLIRLKDFYDLIITFRYVKIYSGFRMFVSWTYNLVLKILFKTKYRDISSGLRLIRKNLAQELELISCSPFIGAEITIKTMLCGYRVGEVGIQTFPRELGKGESTTLKNIIATVREMIYTYRTIFSEHYDLPLNRGRKTSKTNN